MNSRISRAGLPFAGLLALAIANVAPHAAGATPRGPASAKAACAAAPATLARIERFTADRPQMAVEQNVFGTTVVRVDLDAAGRLQRADVLESSGALALDAAALSGARAASYSAGTSNCASIAGSYAVTIDFTS